MRAPMPVLRQFFADFGAADRAALHAGNEACRGLDAAICFLADFTLDNLGLTPEQAQALFEKLESYHGLNDAASEAELKKENLVFRLAENLGLPIE